MYNSIQALAQHYADLHRQAIIRAMDSKRNVMTTELPSLTFVQEKRDGEVCFTMVDYEAIVQYEGPELKTFPLKAF